MIHVTLTKTRYEQLQRQAEAFRVVAAKFFELAVRDPIEDVMAEFRQTNLYTNEFLNDMEDGLRHSSYSKTYAHKAVAPRSRRVPREA